ncbi:ATP-grasp domain-containing protein [Bacillus mangrovi]|uniref:ATP-grasp domain-containing protein n=1 Tax=Metabacillus mangrovi TaxID=1491830 RepID=A0A7X2S6G1_9BACI|nr:ATP-grasp domain-containing protein [Metabacillus mangrovi]
MKKLVVIGANEFQKKLVVRANELGYETHVFAWEEGAVAKEIADFFYPISITDKESIFKFVSQINPDGICSVASDMAMPTVNYIAKKLGLIGNSLESTELTTNKFKMRKALSEENLPCPNFYLVKDSNSIDFEGIKFPVIIKPIDRSGSRGIRRVEYIDEIDNAIENAKTVSSEDRVLVEEYIDGKEYSVEHITQNGRHIFLQITEKFTTGAPNFIEKGHLSPARLSNEKKQEIINIVEKSLSVLKVENGASHSEVKITPDGKIKIIEIAARMGGDFIGSDMVYLSTGFDFLESVIRVAVGEPIKLDDFNPIEKNSMVSFIFNDFDKGKFEFLKKMYPTIIKEYYIKKEMNNVYDSSSRNGYFILETTNKELLSEVLKVTNMED